MFQLAALGALAACSSTTAPKESDLALGAAALGAEQYPLITIPREEYPSTFRSAASFQIADDEVSYTVSAFRPR